MIVRCLIGRLAAAVLFVVCLAPAPAQAIEILPGGIELKILDGAGNPDDRAGAHPDRMTINFELDETGGDEDPKDIIIDLPPGLSGNLSAVPPCLRTVFGGWDVGTCQPSSEIGSLTRGSGSSQPVYLVEPGPNEVALFGAFGTSIFTSLRPSDQGLRLEIRDLGHLSEPFKAQIELWGIPADHQLEAGIPREALLTLPTRCGGAPPTVIVSTHTWQQPERWISGTGSTGLPLSGCEQLPFDPSVAMALGSSGADAPTGASFELAAKQNLDPDGRAAAAIRDVSLSLPEGMAISAAGASTLAACSDAQLGLGSDADPSCPGASRVGTVEVASLSTSKPMHGSVYLGRELPGERFRLFIAAAGSGAQIKAIGTLRPDPVSGRLGVTIHDLPEVALDRMTLSFDGGPGALLATPMGCGEAVASTVFTPYSGTASVQRSASARISGCPASVPFSPGFSAGVLSPTAGKATAFTATIARRDGEGLPERLELSLPPGMNAALGTVTPCSDQAARSGACPASSRIGSSLAELGPGANAAQLHGGAYLTGPYKGAPYGLALLFKAAIGPFDLGQMVVRDKVEVNPQSGQVSVLTDSLPTSLEGIPLRLRTLGLDIDRPGFIHNPTSCGPKAVGANLRSTAGARASAVAPFRARGCVGLRFHPRFSLALSGRGELHEGGRPGLRIAGKVPAGGANIANAEIGLPKLLKLDASKLAAICSRRDAAAERCPKGSRVGSASARTPLLAEPMVGSVYAVQPKGGGTPDIWTSLRGSGLEVILRGETAAKDGRVQARLTDLPDFTLGSFALNFAGGEGGVFKLKGSPCKAGAELLVPTAIEGQNRALRSSRERARVTGCG